ncbi:hypothetical protein GCM10023196_048040 [Actinoallomurus vinaceus]|uniref:Uncharacterized protein n=1 Tax=Actinoallomurus vinaceus TaxID=1080074 RepID=A0ABP8UE39_9ACTN
MSRAEEPYGGNAPASDQPRLPFVDPMLPDPTLGASGDDLAGAPHERVDTLIRRLFAVGLDLHGALGHVQAHVDEEGAVRMIQQAIAGLDEAIKDFRGAMLDLWPPVWTAPGIRSSIVRAVERAYGPGTARPVITLSGGADLPDGGIAHQVGAVLQQIFDLIPADRLAGARVEMASDPRPPGRLTVHIDVPGADLGDVAARLGASEPRVTVSSEAVTAPASRSHIHLECVAPAR